VRVLVSLGSVLARTEAAGRSLRLEQPAAMKALLESKAALERGTHLYRNRTGNAERSTQSGDLAVGADDVRCDLMMGVRYAIYLDARRLTRIVPLAEEARGELLAYFEAERDRLAGL
jgi:hypothetical protein